MPIEIEEPTNQGTLPPITLSRTDRELAGLVDLPAVKLAYWRRCVNGTDPVTGQPYTRFVGYSEHMSESRGNTHKAMPIWIPQGPDDEFNLVLSLCTDGMHRPLVDVDELTYEYSASRLPGTKMLQQTVVPSTSHWHVYHHYGVDLNRQYEMIGADNQSYADNVRRAGFASLRPPWIVKGWAEANFYRSEFHGFEDADWQEPVPEPDGKIGWEDLFGGN